MEIDKLKNHLYIFEGKYMEWIENVKLIFTSTTGRSGTGYLANLFNSNALNATAEHDPLPTGYGEAIGWYDNSQEKKLDDLVRKKLKRLELGRKLGKDFYNMPFWKQITRYKMKNPKSPISYGIQIPIGHIVPFVPILDFYLESTHSFIKSFAESMYKYVPDFSIIHITRNPLEVAKSFLNRNSIPSKSNPHLLDPEFKRNKLKVDIKMTDFQKCLWYWFETELRHKNFIENHDIKKIYDIDMYELNNKEKVVEMFDYFGIKHKKISLSLKKNKNPSKTKIIPENMIETRELLELIPDWVFDKVGKKINEIEK